MKVRPLLPPASAQFVQQGPKLAAADAIGMATQGSAVAISADGNTAIVGVLIARGHDAAPSVVVILTGPVLAGTRALLASRATTEKGNDTAPRSVLVKWTVPA